MKEIPLTQGKVALVDDEDYEYLIQWKWYYLKNNYNSGIAVRSIYSSLLKRTTGCIRMSRELLKAPNGIEVDHINHDTLDNRRRNLRLATAQQNMRNRRPQRHSSKYKGVSWNKRRQTWRVQITINRNMKTLGYFKSETEAATTYNKAAIELFGKFAWLNAV